MIFLATTYRINGQPASGAEFFAWALVFVAFIAITRFIADRLDRSRIADDLAARGCQPLNISWTPFGKGWFGEKGDRFYDVRYRTPEGSVVQASCKTSMFSGVYWSVDAPPASGPGAFSRACTACRSPITLRDANFCPNCGVRVQPHSRT